MVILQSPTNAQNLPTGQRFNVGTEAQPDVRQCYRFSEQKEILKFKIDCDECQDINKILNEKVAVQETIIDNQLKVLTLKEDNITTLQGEKDRLYKMWSEENLQRHQLENKPVFGGWLGWITAGVFAGATVFLAGYVIAQ